MTYITAVESTSKIGCILLLSAQIQLKILQDSHSHPKRLQKKNSEGFICLLTSHRCPIHDLIFSYCVILMIYVGSGPCCFSLDDIYLHVFDLDSHQQEVDLPDNHIF